MSDQRDLIAETLAEHRLREGAYAPCECGFRCQYASSVRKERAEYERHVADAVLAALGERVLPEGGETREEWGVADDSRYPDEVWIVQPEDRARARAKRLGTPVFRRTVTTVVGSWRPVDTEETNNGR